MLETLDAVAVRRWCATGLAALQHHQGEIDRLNVYPVPDGDTGTNLVLTLISAQRAMAMDLETPPDEQAPPHASALRLMARGALVGARGNSGVIVSEFLRGLAEELSAAPVVRGRALAVALRSASVVARAAVARPAEGTVLTVLAAAATAAEECDTDDLHAVASAAATGASEALAATPRQLPLLAQAGVVDAGGRGLCLLLDALVEVIGGRGGEASGQHSESAVTREGSGDQAPSASLALPSKVTAVRETGSPEYAYEVQFLLDAEPAAVRRLRQALEPLGDSLVVVGGDAASGASRTWNVHVHVNDVSAAVEAGLEAGRPYQISVTRFADQPPPSPSVPDPMARGAVVVASGAGIARLFAAEGATVVPGNPSTSELLDAIHATGAGRVVVLPNDPNTQAAANEAAKEAHRLGVKVSVVPTRSPVQTLAALAVRDPGRRFEDDVIAMAEAAGACRYAELSHASREALTMAGPCQPGDVLALVDGEVHLIGEDLLNASTTLLDRMLVGGGELVTLLVGAQAPPELADAIQAHLSSHWPFVEVQVFFGDQPHHPLLLGVE